MHLVDLESEALPTLDSEPLFSEDSLLSYEFKSNDVAVSVRGRLRKSFHFWKDIDAPRFINLAISCHFFIDLQIPPPFVGKNNKSAIQESASVENAVSELSSLECISEVFIPPAVLNPLSVSIQKSGKKRLTLDLRHVNQYLF